MLARLLLFVAMLCALGLGLSACFSEVGPTRQIEEPSPGAPPPPLPPPPPTYDDGGRPAVPPPPPKTDSGTTPAPNNQPDADKDGVTDGQDRCSHTSAGKLVWKTGAWAGCAAGQLKDSDDGDRDGVPNGQDKCAGTPIGTLVYKSGSMAGCPSTGSPPPPPPPKKDSGTPPPPPPPPGFTLSAKEKDLLAALNKARASNGLPAVAADAKLTCAARMHATDVAGGCDHTGSDGSWPWDRAKKCGFAQSTWTVNEICAGPGFTSGSDAVSGWKQSSGHWSALISNQAKLVGLGVGANGCYVALFDCCVKSM